LKTLTDKSTNTTQNNNNETTAVATNEGDHRTSKKNLDTLISKLCHKNNNVPNRQTADITTRQPEIGEIGQQTMSLLNTDHTPQGRLDTR
jgi:hypothetical protein